MRPVGRYSLRSRWSAARRGAASYRADLCAAHLRRRFAERAGLQGAGDRASGQWRICGPAARINAGSSRAPSPALQASIQFHAGGADLADDAGRGTQTLLGRWDEAGQAGYALILDATRRGGAAARRWHQRDVLDGACAGYAPGTWCRPATMRRRRECASRSSRCGSGHAIRRRRRSRRRRGSCRRRRLRRHF